MTVSKALLPALAAAALLGACQHQGEAAAQPPLAGASIGGPFTLTDQNGHPVSDRQFEGKYRIVYFGYTFCPDACPTALAAIGQGLRLFEQRDPARAAQIQPIFITVDPQRDTPPVLREYVAHFHPRLIGLTGTQQQIDQVKHEFAVASSRGPADAHGNYTVSHSSQPMLMGRHGEPIALLRTDQGGQAVAQDLEQWVR